MEKKYHPILSKIVATFTVMGHKTHALHTEVGGMMFMGFHTLLDELYNYFFDNLDWLKERAGVLGMMTPFNLVSCLKLSAVKELTEIPPMAEAKAIVVQDLLTIEKMLTEAIKLCGDDKVTENKLIQHLEDLGKFRRKLQMCSME